MAFNGSGTYVRPLPSWAQDKITNPTIQAARMDVDADAVATALSLMICRDGQSTVTSDIDFGNHRLKGVADATADTDAISRLYADTRFRATVTLAALGNLTIPSAAGKVVIQWGSTVVTTNTGSYGSVPYPFAFPTNTFVVIPASGDPSASQPFIASAPPYSPTGFNFYAPGLPSAVVRVNWIAIGS